MTAPDMATIAESLERSMQNCSLSNRSSDDRRRRGGGGDTAVGIGRSSTSDDNINDTTDEHIPISDRTLELNSHISLPYDWEQCLDLKTGEIYYINRKNGMKMNEDPRRLMMMSSSGEYYIGDQSYSYVGHSEEDSSYDSEESSSESPPSSTRTTEVRDQINKEEDVLVVAGCKACFMYFMVPKLVEDCPKCAGQLLHFDRSPDTGSP